MATEPSKLPVRPPAPALFIGPPSRKASHASLRSPQTHAFSSTRIPLARQRTHQGSPHGDPSQSQKQAQPSLLRRSFELDHSNGNEKTDTSSPDVDTPKQPNMKQTKQSTEAIWASMQSTLSEVELNGLSSSSVFGAAHAHALEELRRAQIELARAWARGDADDESDIVHSTVVDSDSSVRWRADKKGDGVTNVLEKAKDDARKDVEREKSRLEEETENDILLARKRREANDRYFERVNGRVVDVLQRLEVVAKKMGGVEMESQEIWGERDSVESGSGE